MSTAACRVASGDHFLTDVIVGAVTGTACGFFVPWMHKGISSIGNSDKECMVDITVQAMPASFSLSLRY